MTFKPTDEQLSIIDHVEHSNENLIINALAGTGKTSTLGLIEKASPKRPILCLAFNKRIADEMAERFPSDVVVRTLNSLGHRVWANTAAGRVTLDAKKIPNLLRERIKELDRDTASDVWDEFWDIVTAIGMAKALGYVPDGISPNARRLISQEDFHASLETRPSVLASQFIDVVLKDSIKTAYKGCIDYNDQIYMPALFGGTFPRFPLVMVDEAQDLNPVNHAMLEKLAKDRLVCVGDPWQSIYGFRGAVREGMSQLCSRFEMVEKTISISFRCPQRIVENVHWRVPHFRWMKPGGHVETLKTLELSAIRDSDVIICRNNAPLFKLALSLLVERRSVNVAGSDVGPRIIATMRKLGSPATDQDGVQELISEWLVKRLENAQSPDNIHDLAECMRVFATWGANLGQAIAYAERLFGERGAIRLITGHKSKGLEFDVVYHLDPWLCKDHEQDLNLRYVISTRSKDRLYEINSEAIH